MFSFIDLPGPVEFEKCSLSLWWFCTMYPSKQQWSWCSIHVLLWMIHYPYFPVFINNGKLQGNTAPTALDPTSAHCSVLQSLHFTGSVRKQFLSIPWAHRQVTNSLYIYQCPKLWISHHRLFCTIILQIIWPGLKIKNKSAKVLWEKSAPPLSFAETEFNALPLSVF